jgi:hypothetical protein
VIPYYPQVRSGVLAVNADLAPGSTLVSLMSILVVPAAVVTVVIMLTLGLVVGGRGRLDLAIASAGVALLPASVGTFVLMLVHLREASGVTHDVPTLLAALAGMNIGPLDTSDQPAHSALGLMILAQLLLMYAVGLPAALLGSLIRAVRPARADRSGSARPTWRAVAFLLPLGLAFLTVGYLSWSEVRAPMFTDIEVPFDRTPAELEFAKTWPQDVPLREACTAILRSVGDVGQDAAADKVFVIAIARAAMNAGSSADPTLRIFGEGIVEAIRDSQLRRSARGVAVALTYCAHAGTFS